MPTVDLFLGSDLGKWALEQISPADVGMVIAVDESIVTMAAARGIAAFAATPATAPPPRSAVGFSVHFPRIFPAAFIERYRMMYNLHPGFLPWGRGYYPVFWALWEGTPAGATLHQISPGIDEGPLVGQRQVAYGVSDTGQSLFDRVRNAEKELFAEFWPRMVAEQVLPTYPQSGSGTYHRKQEFLDLQRIDLDRSDMPASRVLHLARALTFPGYKGLAVVAGGACFEVTVKPETESGCK